MTSLKADIPSDSMAKWRTACFVVSETALSCDYKDGLIPTASNHTTSSFSDDTKKPLVAPSIKYAYSCKLTHKDVKSDRQPVLSIDWHGCETYGPTTNNPNDEGRQCLIMDFWFAIPQNSTSTYPFVSKGRLRDAFGSKGSSGPIRMDSSDATLCTTLFKFADIGYRMITDNKWPTFEITFELPFRLSMEASFELLADQIKASKSIVCWFSGTLVYFEATGGVLR
jgi:hypothetical protein